MDDYFNKIKCTECNLALAGSPVSTLDLNTQACSSLDSEYKKERNFRCEVDSKVLIFKQQLP